MKTNRPIKKIEDWPIEGAIFQNHGEKGAFFTFSLTKAFKKPDGSWGRTTSFASNDALKLSEVARQTHHELKALSATQRQFAPAAHPPSQMPTTQAAPLANAEPMQAPVEQPAAETGETTLFPAAPGTPPAA